MGRRKKLTKNSFNRGEVWAILLFILAIVISLSIIGYNEGEIIAGTDDPEHFLKSVGVVIAEVLVLKTLGYFSIIFPIIMMIVSYAIFFKKDLKYYIIRSIHLFGIILSIAILFYSKIEISGPWIHYTGTYLYKLLNPTLFYILVPLFTIILIASFLGSGPVAEESVGSRI